MTFLFLRSVKYFPNKEEAKNKISALQFTFESYSNLIIHPQNL